MRFVKTRAWALGAVLASALMAGCGTAPKKEEAPVPPSDIPRAGHIYRHLIVFCPLTDEDVQSWLSLLQTYPRLRMVLAVSPRFKVIEKNAEWRLALEEGVKAGRLELALQLPNPAILPLLIDSNSARESLPPGTPLPEPAYAYPDDVVQQIARAKADYYQVWKTLPKGLVVPYGALSPALVRQLERLGFSWAVGAMGNTQGEAAFRSGPLVLWDGTPAGGSLHTLVRVWDDRTMMEASRSRKSLESWAKELQRQTDIDAILPSDHAIPAGTIPDPSTWKRRTWMTPDWSTWIGTSAKNEAWARLRKTRETLEAFKNSGQASVHRLDLAMEELFSAQSASYFGAIGNPAVIAAADRESEFNASLASVYKLMNQAPPETLFSAAQTPLVPVTGGSVARLEVAAGREQMVIEDAAGDERMAPKPTLDLREIRLVPGLEAVDIAIQTAGTDDALVDLYIDLNRTPEAGTLPLLSDRGVNASPADAWEYAISVRGEEAHVYRTQTGGTFEWAGSFPVTSAGAIRRMSIPRSVLKGSPARWGYQALTMIPDPASPAKRPKPLKSPDLPAGTPPVYDVIDPPDTTQALWFELMATGVRDDLPFVRLRR